MILISHILNNSLKAITVFFFRLISLKGIIIFTRESRVILFLRSITEFLPSKIQFLLRKIVTSYVQNTVSLVNDILKQVRNACFAKTIGFSKSY
nr:MAG TPA: hypothetical protein [Caudoviricetes sp.]